MAKLTVAFQGERGSFSEQAANNFYETDIKPTPQATFEQVFTEIENGNVDAGIVPIENSLIGSIHQNYDLLLRYNLKVRGELTMRIIHALIAHKGVSVENLQEIHSHPAALAQCNDFLKANDHIEAVPSYDTAGSAKMIKDKGIKNAGAIAGLLAADIYEMEVLKSEIEDEKENYTRFLILGKNPIKKQEGCKTSIVFALKNIPGALFKALSVFALRDIDLSKIESRPVRTRKWEYYFYLDFFGHFDDTASRNALSHLREITSFLKILGSYPTADND